MRKIKYFLTKIINYKMSNVQHFVGHSIYKDQSVTDKDICDLVGLDTYKALYNLNPELYTDFTYPMEPSQHRMEEIRGLISLHDDLDGSTLRSYLVMRHIDGPNSENVKVVVGLVNSSEPMTIPGVCETTRSAWVLCVFIITLLVVFVIVFYIWPSLEGVRNRMSQTYGSPSKWLETPWL